MILATDMSKHFADINKFKTLSVSSEFDPTDKDKVFCLMMALHLSDISHAGKAWNICQKWTDKIF